MSIDCATKPKVLRNSRDGINVGFVTDKGLDGLSATDIPELGSGVASTGDKDIGI